MVVCRAGDERIVADVDVCVAQNPSRELLRPPSAPGVVFRNIRESPLDAAGVTATVTAGKSTIELAPARRRREA